MQENAHIDLWLKEIAPSDTLRKWFNHDPKKWQAFRKKYITELADKKELAQAIQKASKKETITLLFAAKDLEHNHAIVLRDFLLS